MSNQPQQQYQNNEIFTFANQSVLIGFNSLMKNVQGEQDSAKRKDLSKKNKIQISYVDLKNKDDKGKRIKHDFFVDIEDMKYFVDMVYQSLVNPSKDGNQVRKHGLKIMGGHKKPQVISNIFTFNFLTGEEFNNSQPNQKVLNKFEQDKSKYDNAMLDWKNLQVAKLQFDKKVGKVLNGGLIIPTGQKAPNANFKPYYISQQELLEFCVTMKDYISRTETVFLMESKFAQLMDDKFSQFENKVINTIKQIGNGVQPSPSQQVPNNQQSPNEKQGQQPNQQSAQNQGQQSNNQQQRTPEQKQQALHNEFQTLMSNARDMFVGSFKQDSMGTFLDCLNIQDLVFQNNQMQVSYTFNSQVYNIQDFQNERQFFNEYYERCLLKQVELLNKNYSVLVSKL